MGVLDVIVVVRDALVLGAVAFMLAFFAVSAICWASPIVRRFVGRYRRLDFAGKIVIGAFVAVMYVHGSTKAARSVFRFDTGLRDNGSYSTNDLVHAAWTWSGGVIPSDKLHVDYQQKGTEQAGTWYHLGETTVGSGFLDMTLENATNYNFFVYSEYVPDTPVHTNGVYVLQAAKSKDGKKVLTVKAFVIDNGEITAPPKAKDTVTVPESGNETEKDGQQTGEDGSLDDI